MTETQIPTHELARAVFTKLAKQSYADPKAATSALTELADHFPVVSPGGTTSVVEVAAGHKVLVTSAVPQMCDSEGNGGDVFRDRSSGTICFRASFLKQLAAGLGLEWIPSETRIAFPANGDPFCVSVTVAARYRDWSGEWRVVSASKVLDLRDGAAHGMKEKQLQRARGDIASRAETMAKSRCIADACVSRTIAESDVGKPIIMAKLYRVDPIDAGAARDALYGKPRTDETIDRSTGEVVKTADATVSDPDSSAQGKAASPSPGSGAAAPTAPASPAPERPATSFACKVSASYPKEALRKKPLAELTDADLSAYVDWSEHRITTEAPGWPKESREGAQKAMNAAYAEVAWREAQKGGGSKGNGGEW